MAVTASGNRFPLVRINDRVIEVEPRETILQAALRNGIEFPNNCRVGGCGTCRCRLSEGRVRELTETGYLLTAEEIEGGTILACQSVPQSDVRIEVDLSTLASRRPVMQSVGRLAVHPGFVRAWLPSSHRRSCRRKYR